MGIRVAGGHSDNFYTNADLVKISSPLYDMIYTLMRL